MRLDWCVLIFEVWFDEPLTVWSVPVWVVWSCKKMYLSVHVYFRGMSSRRILWLISGVCTFLFLGRPWWVEHMFVSSMMIWRFIWTISCHAQDDLICHAVVYFSFYFLSCTRWFNCHAVVYFSFGGSFSIGTYYRVTSIRGSPACLGSQRGTHEKDVCPK